MADLYDPVKARQVSQGFNGATGTAGVQSAVANVTAPSKSTAIERRLAKQQSPIGETE